jgi:CBS domain-containing protein
MQRDVLTVFAEAPVSDVARLLWDSHIGGAPVVNALGRPIGFISSSDVVRYKAYGIRLSLPPNGAANEAAVAEYELLQPLPPMRESRAREPVARDLMTPTAIWIRPNATVPELARFLTEAGIHRAVVMEAGLLVGIASVSDIVREVADLAAPTPAADAIGG